MGLSRAERRPPRGVRRAARPRGCHRPGRGRRCRGRRGRRSRPPAPSRPRRPAGGSRRLPRSPRRGARRGGSHPLPLPPGPIVRRAALTVRGAGAARAPAGSPRCGWCRGSGARPPEVRAIKSSAGRRRRRRRQERRRRRGEEDSGGLAGAGSPCPALQRGEPTGPGAEEKRGRRRRRRAGGGGESCCRLQTGGAGTGRRSPRCRGCTSPNPAPSRRGSRRRQEAAESPLQRSRAAAARHGRSPQRCRLRRERGACLGGAARPQAPGQPVGGRGGGAATTALRRCGAGVGGSSRSPPPPPPAGHQKGRAAPRWPWREGRVKAGGSPAAGGRRAAPKGRGGPRGWRGLSSRLKQRPRGKGEQRPSAIAAPFCGFWGPSDVGALRGGAGVSYLAGRLPPHCPWRGHWLAGRQLGGC